MAQIQQDLLQRIKTLEDELKTALEEKERAFGYHWVKGKARFEQDVLSQHAKLRHPLPSYILHSRLLVLATAPLIYLVFIPFALLDLFVRIYQAVCFPIYGIPRVKREEYLVFDRGHLKYLNLLERLNCAYCSYANGLCAYVTEMAARTEQHWCPIKHALRIRAPHSRYGRFFDYGNAEQYSRQIETIRSDFVDLESLTSKQTPREPDSRAR